METKYQRKNLPVIAHLFSFRRISRASTFRSRIEEDIFLQNMAANDVSKTTHIYSSKSADQLISARDNKEFIPSGTYKQINKKPEHEL
jgi:hypothetical protein